MATNSKRTQQTDSDQYDEQTEQTEQTGSQETVPRDPRKRKDANKKSENSDEEEESRQTQSKHTNANNTNLGSLFDGDEDQHRDDDHNRNDDRAFGEAFGSNHDQRAIAGYFDTLLQTNITDKFQTRFNGDPRNVLKFAADWVLYKRLHPNLVNPGFVFNKLFAAVSKPIREKFVQYHGIQTAYTDKMLMKWLINSYPPPYNKFYFIACLKSLTQRYNEKPSNVFEKFEIILKKVNDAIYLLNETKHKNDKIAPIDDEHLAAALRLIFFEQNNKKANENNGNINKLTKSYLIKHNPTTYADWQKAFENIGQELIPRVAETDPEYQYTHYKLKTQELDIYSEHFRNNPLAQKAQNWRPFAERYQWQTSPAFANNYQIDYNSRGRDNNRSRGRGISRGRNGGRGRGRNDNRGRGGHRRGGGYRGRGGYKSRGGYRGRGGYKRQNYFDNDQPNNKRHKGNDHGTKCPRCKLGSHQAHNCYSKRHISGYILRDQTRTFCKICKKRGHETRWCPNKNAASTPNPQHCRRCGDTGHTAEACDADYKINGDPLSRSAMTMTQCRNTSNTKTNNHTNTNTPLTPEQATKELQSLYRQSATTNWSSLEQQEQFRSMLATAYNTLNTANKSARQPPA